MVLGGSVVDVDAGGTPGRSALSSVAALPVAALLRQDVQPNALPAVKLRLASRPAGGRSAADGHDHATVTDRSDPGELGREQPALLVGGHEHRDDREGQGPQRGPLTPKKKPTRSGP